MEELIYTIDKIRTEQDDVLTIKIQVARRINYTLEPHGHQPVLTHETLLKLASPRDCNLIPFLIKEEAAYQKSKFKITIDRNRTALNVVHISHQSMQEALKQFAIAGRLYIDSKPIVIDLFSPVTLFYSAQGSQVSVMLQNGEQLLPLTACSLVGRGPPHFFINGIQLKLIKNEISWKDLKAAYSNKIRPFKELVEEANDDIDAPRVMIEGEISHESIGEPLPILFLKDRLGSFAILKMDYGNGCIFDFSDPLGQKNATRNIKAEAAWEKDLLETDFIKKQVGDSHYYCPLDKVSKSIAFLLEIGWHVIDSKGRRVKLQTGAELNAETVDATISITGKVHYETFNADISEIIGAFNRRERFVEIAPGHVALLPNTWEGNTLDGLADQGEIVGDAIAVKRSRIGSLEGLFAPQTNLRCSPDLKLLKGKLTTFQGINPAIPSQEFIGTLRPYQQDGVNWLAFLKDFGFHGLLADDMGLGKTVQTIAFLSTLSWKLPVLIVMPTSLIFNWKRELEKFLPAIPVIVHHGPMRKALPETFSQPPIILTTYATLRQDLNQFLSVKYECLILDEAQAIKNSQTQTFQAVAKLDAIFRLSITGTPVENNLMELWSHFHFLMPELLGSEETFQGEMQAGMSDPRFLRRIQRQIRPFVLRRRKEDVAKDLPEKIEQTIWVEMGSKQREVYDSFLSGVRKNLLEKVSVDGASKHRMEILESIMRLRQICCHPHLVDGETPGESSKLDALIEDLKTIVAEGGKVLVYSQFTSMLTLISKKIKEYGWQSAYLDGSTRDREKVVSDFQNNVNIPIFLISLKAGGIGLNLTAADYVFLYDPWWNNAVENQAIDRAHRIGRKDTVIARRYVATESIEEKIMKLKEAKSALAADLLDDTAAISNLSTQDLLFLLQG